MKRLSLLSILFVTGSCFAGHLTTNEVDLLEVAFRQVLTRYHHDEAVFLSLRWDAEAGIWNEPPPELIARFKDHTFKIRPISEARFVKPEDKRGKWGVQERDTGKKGTVYFVSIVKKDGDEYILETGFHVEALYAEMVEYKANRIGGKWTLKPTGKGWIS